MPNDEKPLNDFDRLAIQREGEYRRILLVFGAAWIVRLMHILSLKVSPIFSYKIGDAAKYDAWAQSLASGNWLGEGVFYQAPLYPYFLGIVYSTLGDSILTVRLVQSLIGAVSCVLLMLAGTNLFGKKSGLVSGLCLAFYAPSIFLEGLIQKSTLDLFFLCLLLWLISKIVFRPRPALWIVAGLTTGALCLTRENALILLPIFLAWICVGTFRKIQASSFVSNPNTSNRMYLKSRAGWLMAFGLGLMLTLGPVAMRNFLVGGQFHLTTSQLGPNFYIGNNADANGTYRPLRPGRGDAKFEQNDAVELAEIASGKSLTPKEVSQYYLNLSFEFIRQQPVRWLQLMALKTGMTFNRHEVIDTEDQYTVSRWSPTLALTEVLFNFGLLVPLSLLGMYVTRARWRRLWVLYAIMFAFAATVVAFFVFGRYRFPLVPPMILFLGPACISLAQLFQSKKRIQVVATVLLLGTILAVCNLRLISPRNGQAITLSNYGVQALIRDDFENAERFLRISAQQLPDNALVQNNIAVLYRETNRPQLALKHFQRAHELEPGDETIRRNLERLRDNLEKKQN